MSVPGTAERNPTGRPGTGASPSVGTPRRRPHLLTGAAPRGWFRSLNAVDIRNRQATLAVNVVLAVVFAAALATTAGAIMASWGNAYWQFDCAVGVVASLLALGRGFHRGWTAVAGLVVAAAAIVIAGIADLPHEPGPVTALALSVLVGSAIRTLPGPWAGAIAAGGLVLVIGCWLAYQPLAFAIGAVTGMNAVGWLLAVAVGSSLRLLDGRRRSIAEAVRLDERLELARELHDVVAHHITGIVIQAQAAQLVAGKHSEKLAESLAAIELAGSDGLAAMRRVVGLLRDTADAASASPGPEQLSVLVDRFNRHGPAVHLRVPDDTGSWPPEVTTTVYRIVQESLTNISRHAPHARSVTVAVDQDPDTITVEVADDAPLPRPRYPHRGGHGLVGMHERVQTLGGTLSVGPRPGAGWSVLATLPVYGREPR
jgi:signal transduction histidine kinase